MAAYPQELEREVALRDGSRILVRPIRPEDADMELAFVEGLSPQSRYFRFMDTLRTLTPAMLRRFTHIDYDRHMALIAVSGEGADAVEVGVCRYVRLSSGDAAEFAIVIADAWQGRGLGRVLIHALMDVARSRGLKTLYGDVLATNPKMLKLMSRLGFSVELCEDDPMLRRVVMEL